MIRIKAFVVIEGSDLSDSEFDLTFQIFLGLDLELLTDCSTSNLVFNRKSLNDVGPSFNSEIHFLRVTACASESKQDTTGFIVSRNASNETWVKRTSN